VIQRRSIEERLAYVQGYANAVADIQRHGLDFAKRTIPLMHEVVKAVREREQEAEPADPALYDQEAWRG